MRTIVLVLLSTLVLAGCASNNNGGTPTTTPTTGGGGTNSTMAQTPVKTDTHDFSTCAAPAGTPVSCSATTPFNVSSALSQLYLNVSWTAANGAPAAVVQGVSVKVGGMTCTLPDGPFTGAPNCSKQGAAAGVAKIEYAGSGPVVAKVVVTGS
jgi:hypothetical protein